MTTHQSAGGPPSRNAPMPGDPHRTGPIPVDARRSRRATPSPGVLTGAILVLLGLWGAIVPFVGPYFSFAFTPDQAWTWTSGRGWLEVLPGAVTAVGGALLLVGHRRAVCALGAGLAALGGAWFIVGPAAADWLHLGAPGGPAATDAGLALLQQLAYFDGLGAVVLFLASVALGRLSMLRRREAPRAVEPGVPHSVVAGPHGSGTSF